MWIPFLAAAFGASLVLAQAAPPAPKPAGAPADSAKAAAPAPPPSPVSGMRNKISAGDLLSAESMLEVHRARYGEDEGYLTGLSWLARGALLVGDLAKAERYVDEVRARCADSLARGVDLEESRAVATALGAAIEVKAQLLQRSAGAKPAAEFVGRELATIRGPVSLRSRLNKRINLLTLEGSPAPELKVDDALHAPSVSLASLRGKPLVLFLFAEWCGDCKSQSAGLVRFRDRYAAQGLNVVALTRFYDEPADRMREKARVDSVWKADYAPLGAVPVVFSTESMERYGGSSTPTLVFVDRAGVVRRYTPTRLTDAEFDRMAADILR
jgi:thiol-disulfide isomerase/thioredoxin